MHRLGTREVRELKVTPPFPVSTGVQHCCETALNEATTLKGSKYHYSSYLVAIWAPKVHTILVLGPFGTVLNELRTLSRTHDQSSDGLHAASSRLPSVLHVLST